MDGRDLHPPQTRTLVSLVAILVLLGLSLPGSPRETDWVNDRSTVRYVMADILDLLAEESPAALRELRRTQDLKGMLVRRCAAVPEPVRSCFLSEAGEYLGQLRFTLREGRGTRGPLVLTLAWDDTRGRWFRMERICPISTGSAADRPKSDRPARANRLTYRARVLHSLRRLDRRATA